MPTIESAAAYYPQDDPVHGFDHVLRVVRVSLKLANAVGADLEIVKAAALLHDAAGAVPTEDGGRGEHERTSAELARQILGEEGWPEAKVEQVLHCIRAHRYRSFEEPQTLEAQVLFDADKLDVLGAFGIARTLGYAQQAGEPTYAPVSKRFRETGEAESEEPHSAYHEYLFKLRHVSQRLHTAAAKEMAAQREPLLHRFFEQLAEEAGGELETIKVEL
jgi:uncharacterized protein